MASSPQGVTAIIGLTGVAVVAAVQHWRGKLPPLPALPEHSGSAIGAPSAALRGLAACVHLAVVGEIARPYVNHELGAPPNALTQRCLLFARAHATRR